MTGIWMGLLAATTLATAGAAAAQEGAQEAAPAAGGLSLRDLAMMERLGDPRLSPDGAQVLYGVRTTDWDGNKGVGGLWLAQVRDGSAVRLLASTGGAGSGRWSADGQAIYFLSSRGGSSQVWRTDREGRAAVQVTTLPVDVTHFRVSPDGRSLVLAALVFTDCDTLQCTRDRLDATAKSPSTMEVIDEMPLRVFDRWVDGRRSHLILQPLDGSGLADGPARDLMPGLEADVPSQLQGDDGEFVVSPDGRTIVYSANAQGDRRAYTSNSDLFRLSLQGGAPVNLTQGNPAADGSPVFSPDGRRLAWIAGRRENVGGDQGVITVADPDGSNPRPLAQDWDRGPGALSWRSDGRALLTTTADDGQLKLFAVDARTGAREVLVETGAVGGYDHRAGVLAYARDTFGGPTEIFAGQGDPAPMGQHNAEVVARLDLPEAEPYAFAGWNGEEVRGWVFRPVGYQDGRRYPAVYLIHGGPKSPWTSSWSYRWNPQVYTSAGYAVVMINFHGSPGYGQAFTDSINDHWGDRPLEDLQKGWAAALEQNPWIDGERACALGASYGGYMVNLIAGRWSGPWDCLVNHAGVFDVPQLMNAMDIGNFIHEFGGPSWDRMELYRRFSPGDYAGDWSKPMLVLHGSRDFRVPLEQGLAAFSALQRRQVPSRFVHFPDENHWILKPQNWVDWQQQILDWTARWTAE